MRPVVLFAAIAVLASCSPKSPSAATSDPVAPDPRDVERAETLVPADASLAGIYDRSCRACHALDGLGAPMTGHTAAWTPRLDARGLDGLVDSVRSGRGGMPAMGYCADCNDEDFRALITFMSEGNP